MGGRLIAHVLDVGQAVVAVHVSDQFQMRLVGSVVVGPRRRDAADGD